MDYGMLNLGSIVLGLAGWILPILHVSQLSKKRRGLGRYAHILSMGACCLAIWLQICYDEHLVNIEDWSALIDVVPYWSGSLTGFCVLMLALNAIAMLKYQTRRDA